MAKEIRKTLYKFDLTHTQFVILASLYWLSVHNKNITQVEIAEFISIDKMMTSNVIRKLEHMKLLTRNQHEKDTRAKVVQISDKGIEILKNSIEEIENFDFTFFNQLSNQSEFNNELLRLLKDP